MTAGVRPALRGRAIPDLQSLRPLLNGLYERYNRRDFLFTDPLIHLYRYDDPLDREVAGFIAASLAYGRVAQINRSVSAVLNAMAPSPRGFVMAASPALLGDAFGGFRHRFTTARELTGMLLGLREVIERYGSLNACFLRFSDRRAGTVLPALAPFVETIRVAGGIAGRHSLLPRPEGKSACKRLNLFLRWMVRRDEVDPGCWQGIPPSRLLVPLDAHLHRTALSLGLTARRQGDMKTVLEITDAFRTIDARDPVRYDFALTRPGICGYDDVTSFTCGERNARP